MRLTDEEIAVAKPTLARHAELAVAEGQVTWSELATECGWTRIDRHYDDGTREGDGQKVRDLLGLSNSKRAGVRRLTYDSAFALVRSLGLDPVDIGL